MDGELHVTDGVDLRLLEEADAPDLHAVIESNRARLARWLAWAANQAAEDTLEFIRRARLQARGSEGFQAALIIDGAIAGMVGYSSVDRATRSARIGYWLDEACEGRGTMTAAVRALVDRGLTVWELDRIEIRAAVENRRSRAIPERLGFREEETLRRAELVNGRYFDSVIYAMPAADWRASG